MSPQSSGKKLTFTKINTKGEVVPVIQDDARQKKKNNWDIPPAYFNLGLYLAIPLLLAIGVGQFLDKRFNTNPLFTIILIIFGTISMFYNLIRLYKDDGTTH